VFWLIHILYIHYPQLHTIYVQFLIPPDIVYVFEIKRYGNPRQQQYYTPLTMTAIKNNFAQYTLQDILIHTISNKCTYTLSNKNLSVWNFLSPEPEVTCGTVAIVIRVVLLSQYLRIRGVSLSSIHYNQSHRVYINRRQQYIYLIWNLNIN